MRFMRFFNSSVVSVGMFSYIKYNRNKNVQLTICNSVAVGADVLLMDEHNTFLIKVQIHKPIVL